MTYILFLYENSSAGFTAFFFAGLNQIRIEKIYHFLQDQVYCLRHSYFLVSIFFRKTTGSCELRVRVVVEFVPRTKHASLVWTVFQIPAYSECCVDLRKYQLTETTKTRRKCYPFTVEPLPFDKRLQLICCSLQTMFVFDCNKCLRKDISFTNQQLKREGSVNFRGSRFGQFFASRYIFQQ